MSKLSSLVETFERAVSEADSKRQVVSDLTSQLNTARTQLETAEGNVRSAKSELDDEFAKATAKLTDQGQQVVFA